MPGLFGVNTPRLLYEKLLRSVDEFANQPSEDAIFAMIFPLYHLREWIYPNGYDSYRQIEPEARTREQTLHSELHDLPEYQIVRELCNNAKHFEVKASVRDLLVLSGARVGFVRVGDSLGVTHFIIDGREIRDYVVPVMEKYGSYFQAMDWT